MSTVIKQTMQNGYYFYIEAHKFTLGYWVGVARMIDDSNCSYPDDERVYPTMEKANRRYRDLIRRYGI